MDKKSESFKPENINDWLDPEYKWHNQANDLYKDHRFLDAIRLYRKVLQIKPDMLETRFNLSLAYCRVGYYESAEHAMSKVIIQNPNLGEAYYTRGLIREYRGEYQKAAQDYAEAHRLDYDKAFVQLGACVGKARDVRPTMPQNSQPDNDNGKSGKDSGLKSEEDKDLPDYEPVKLDSGLSYDDYGGECDAKTELQTIGTLFKHCDEFADYGGIIPRGVLLYGDPGTGKTHLARIFARECEAAFFNIALKDILSVWFSYSEKAIYKLFDTAAKCARAVIFFDEIDAIAVTRSNHPGDRGAERRIMAALLSCMDGFDNEKYNNIMVLGATNMVDVIDPALKRPGRFSRIIRVERPGAADRAEIYRIHVDMVDRKASRQVFAPNLDYDRLGETSGGLVGDEIRNIVQSVLIKNFTAKLTSLEFTPIATDDIVEATTDYRKSRQPLRQRIGFHKKSIELMRA